MVPIVLNSLACLHPGPKEDFQRDFSMGLWRNILSARLLLTALPGKAVERVGALQKRPRMRVATLTQAIVGLCGHTQVAGLIQDHRAAADRAGPSSSSTRHHPIATRCLPV